MLTYSCVQRMEASNGTFQIPLELHSGCQVGFANKDLNMVRKVECFCCARDGHGGTRTTRLLSLSSNLGLIPGSLLGSPAWSLNDSGQHLSTYSEPPSGHSSCPEP